MVRDRLGVSYLSAAEATLSGLGRHHTTAIHGSRQRRHITLLQESVTNRVCQRRQEPPVPLPTSFRSEPGNVGPGHPRPVPCRTDPSRVIPWRPVPLRGVRARAVLSRAQPSRVEPSRVDPSRASCSAIMRPAWHPDRRTGRRWCGGDVVR